MSASHTLMTTWEELLETHDEIVYIPMSSGLSGSLQTAKMLSEEYDGKVVVVDNQRISVTQRQSVLDALELAQRGQSAEEIRNYLETVKLESFVVKILNINKFRVSFLFGFVYGR